MKRMNNMTVKLFFAVYLAMLVLSGCSKEEPVSLEGEVQETVMGGSPKAEPAEENASFDGEESDQKAESVEEKTSSDEEDADLDRQAAERIREYKEKLDQRIVKLENMLAYCRRDVQADFLQTLQFYYLSTGNYTTEESTIGDLITSTVADSICSEVAGGSSTMSTALVTAAKGISAGDNPGEIVTNTFVDAMEELPNEVTTRVYDYLLGETVFKALDVFNALTTNRQTQHLANLVDTDIRNDIQELSHICSKEELTLEDCYKGKALADSILEKTYEIEQVLGVNAGSAAWRPYYQEKEDGEQYGNYISADLNEIAWSLLEIERIQRCKEVLDTIEHVERATQEEVCDAFETPMTSFSSYFDLSAICTLEDDIKSMYDWNDSVDRSQKTKIWNVADSLIGNPVTNIILERYNQQEGRFADALAEFNSQARSVWLDQYIPLKCKLEHLNAYSAHGGADVVDVLGVGDEIDRAIAMAYLKAQLGEEITFESFWSLHGDRFSELYGELYALLESTRILYDTYYVAMVDSESNTVFLNNYRRALRTIGNVLVLCSKPEEEPGSLPYQFTNTNQSCVKIAEAAKKLMDFYIENCSDRSDVVEKANVNFPNEEGIPITCTLYTKSPANGVEEDYLFAGIAHREGFQDIRCYGHRVAGIIYLNEADYFWIQDGNSGVSNHITIGHSRGYVSDASLVPDELLALMRLRGIWSLCCDLQKNPEPLISGIPQLFEVNIAAERQLLLEDISARQETEEKEQDHLKPFLDIQARIEAGEDVVWAKPEELEKLYIEKYVKTTKYKELLELYKQYNQHTAISDEPEGFGTLTCIQPLSRKENWANGYDYNTYESIYKTGGGKELRIVLTDCWYEDNGKYIFLDYFLPEAFYDGDSLGIMSTPVERADPDVLHILEP